MAVKWVRVRGLGLEGLEFRDKVRDRVTVRVRVRERV